MAEPIRDRWAEWVLHRQHGGSHAGKHISDSEFLRSLRDQVLRNAEISEGETLLDVGTGDGLIAFGALDLLGENGQVIFSDVSQNLLDHSRTPEETERFTTHLRPLVEEVRRRLPDAIAYLWAVKGRRA